jgi:hypothetical protein
VAQLVVLEFPTSVGRAEYDAVNAKLGIDPADGGSGWPAGMQWHGAGANDDGAWVVAEVWDSREAQHAFMESRLMPAFQAVSLPEPTRVMWTDLATSTVVGQG